MVSMTNESMQPKKFWTFVTWPFRTSSLVRKAAPAVRQDSICCSSELGKQRFALQILSVASRGLYLAEEGEISVVDEARRSGARLPWCAARPVADDCLEKEGTTK
jgi:hypothetical protein